MCGYVGRNFNHNRKRGPTGNTMERDTWPNCTTGESIVKQRDWALSETLAAYGEMEAIIPGNL